MQGRGSGQLFIFHSRHISLGGPRQCNKKPHNQARNVNSARPFCTMARPQRATTSLCSKKCPCTPTACTISPKQQLRVCTGRTYRRVAADLSVVNYCGTVESVICPFRSFRNSERTRATLVAIEMWRSAGYQKFSWRRSKIIACICLSLQLYTRLCRQPEREK